jgi:hypothetical protein
MIGLNGKENLCALSTNRFHSKPKGGYFVFSYAALRSSAGGWVLLTIESAA